MISRKTLWFVALAFLAVLGVTWWAGNYPARVVVINQGVPVRALTVRSAGEAIAIGDLRPPETRVVKVPSGDYVTVDFEGSQHRTWQSPDRIAPAQSLTVTIRANERVEWSGGQRPRAP